MKLTKKRQEILDIIKSSETPINVKFLKSKVTFDLSTIYRSLDFLEKNKFVFSFDLENERYYFKEENANFFVCNSCKHIENITEFSNSETENEKDILKKKGFSPLSHLSIFKGKCNDCN
ncbi:transcriptional repressor [Leptotrichia sp. OH3620_COT-345]|uniref:Fur family transcriptional regulator n=1 Tax=Leptotrichia sp. OH3620_COT-345 TaxID=2491048 RepID=UPI000F64DF5B|nr:transcriptional repressor [Leptotrichia sp. OH3620_COT-345]RRD39360.1 transcriptional repressor [Leptotrichia sp. OH3620_COT-345]